MHSDFEYYGGAVGLSSCCLYGGAPYQSQEMKLKRGVDIVIGTPGRIKVVFSCSSVMEFSFFFFLSNVWHFCLFVFKKNS